jgi:hypothetical protein
LEHDKRKRDEVSSNPGGRKVNKKEGVPHEQITRDRLWNQRPDDIAFKMTTKTKVGLIWLMEFKSVSYVTNQYLVRSTCVSEEQYESFRSALSKTMEHPGWLVEQIIFITGE